VRGKNLIWLCLIAMMIASPLVMPRSFAQPPATVVVNPPTTITNPAQDFTIEVDVLGGTNVAGFDLKITWNVALTDFPPTTSLGEFLGSTGISTSPLFENDNFLFKYVQVGAFLTAPGGVDGDGALAYFTFHVKATQSGSSVLHIYDVKLFDQDGNLLPLTTQDGSFGTTAPYVDFTITPSNPDVGQLVTFDGSPSYDPANPSTPLADYMWDFGDGSPVVHGKVVTHTYSAYNINGYPVTLTATNANGESWHVTKALVIWRDLQIAVVWPTITETDTTDYDAYQTTNDYYETPGYGLLSVIVVVQNLGTKTETYSLDVVVSGKDYFGKTHTWDITSTGADTGWGQPYPATVSPNGGSGYANWFFFDISYNASTSMGLFGFNTNKPVPPGQYTITATLTDAYDQDPTNNVKSVPFGVHGSVEGFAMQGFNWHGWSSGTTTFWGMMMNLDNTTAIALPPTQQGEYAYMEFTIVNLATGATTVLDSPVSYLNYWQWAFVSVSTTLAAGKYTCSYIVYFGTDGVNFPYFGQYSRTFKFTVFAPTHHHGWH